MSATATAPKRAQQKQLDLSFFALVPLMLAAAELRHHTQPQGRVPMLDDVCSECEFELRNPTATIAYIVTEEVTYSEHRGKKQTHIKSKRHSVWHEVHWCPRHQHEVVPLKHGRVSAARSTIEEAFAEVNVMRKGGKINGL